jgi:putative ABC transport system permease protein
VERLRQDLRYSLRSLQKSPGFSASTVGLLATGIAANVAMFSVASAVAFRPLPYPNGEHAVVVWSRNDLKHRDRALVSGPDFVDWRARSSSFAEMAAFRVRGANLGGAVPQRVRLGEVSPEFTTVLGSKPELGRAFAPGEDDGRARVALISHGLWKQAFGGQSSAVGTIASIDGEPYSIVGVMPAGFDLPEDVQVWTPLIVAPLAAPDMRASHGLTVIARLRDGVGLERAQADMNVVAAGIAEANPGTSKGWQTRIVPLKEQLRGNTAATFLGLLAAVGAVLLVACGNVANLLMARAAGRRRDIWIRTALGADRSRVVRQLLTESLLLSGAAGILGVVLAFSGVRLIVALAPASARLGEVAPGVNVSALVFAVLLSLIVGLLFGTAPALASSSVDVATSLREEGRGLTESRRARSFRSGLASAQIALSVVLLVSAGLLVRSLDALQRVPTGFAADTQSAFEVSLLGPRYADEGARAAAYKRIVAEVSRLPGVSDAAVVSQLPLDGSQREHNSFQIAGQPEPATGQELPGAFYRPISPDYFRVMGIPRLGGREFTSADDRAAPLVAIIDEATAGKYWPGRDPIGRQLMYGRRGGPITLTIVGLVGSVVHER